MNASNSRMPALRGWYSFTVTDAEGTRTREVPNLIVQQGRDSFAANPVSALLHTCRVGVSQMPVSDEQVALGAQVGPTMTASLLTVSSDADSDTISAQFTFAEGTFDNVDISEIGVYDNLNRLFSRALLKDAQGNLEPLTVLKTQRLIVTYSLRVERPDAPIERQLAIPSIGNVLNVHTVRVFPQDRARYLKSGATIHEFSPAPGNLNLCTVTVITDPNYAGVPGTAPAAERETVPAPALMLDPYAPGSGERRFAARVDSAYGNKPSGITGIEVTHPVLGTMLTATVQPAVVKTSDWRFLLDLSLEW